MLYPELSLFNDLEDGSLRVNIGVILIEWLEDCNLITKKLVKLQSSQHNFYYTPEELINEWENVIYNEMWTSSDLSNTLLSQQNMVLSPSFRLPAIVEPKPYKIINNKKLII